MDRAIAQVEFTSVDGAHRPHELTVYSLSTCAFCKRAMQFLRENSVAFRFVYLDQLDFDLKRAVKAELKERYGDIRVYPILTVDDDSALTGFVQEKWAEAAGLPSQ